MKKRNLLLIGLILLFGSLTAQNPPSSSKVEARVLPAIYKTKGGLMQRVEVIIMHSGAPITAAVSLGKHSIKEELKEGQNKLAFDIPQVQSTKQLTLIVKKGGNETSSSITVNPVRHWEMNFVQHTHTDIGYTRPQMEILADHLRFIDYALDYCDATDNYPDNAKFRWTCEITWAVNEYIKCRPEKQVARLKQRIKEGRIELAAMYLNFDELPDEQSLAASLYPLKQLRENGMPVEVAMQNDVNGIGWCFIEFFANAGVKYISMGTHGHRAIICFDNPTVFWWQSPSGKKILTYNAEIYHQGNTLGIHRDNFEEFEERVFAYLDIKQAKNYPFDIVALQYSGYLTDNSPPAINCSKMLQKWNDKYEWPKLRTAVASAFLKEVETNYADKIETIKGAWPDWWTDGFGSGAREAAITRITHAEVIADQGGLSFAKMLGAKLPSDISQQINQVNKSLLFYGEHTFGSSKSVRDPHSYEVWEQRALKQSYAWEASRCSGMLGEATTGILQEFVPKADVPSIVVFNTLNWSHSGLITTYIDYELLPFDKEFEIVDAAGNVIPTQIRNTLRGRSSYWTLYVKDVPALGYAQYYIKVKDTPRAKAVVKTNLDKTLVENPWYTINFNKQKGTITKLFDKELNKQLLTPNAEWELGEFIYEIIDNRKALNKRWKTLSTPQVHTKLQSIRRRPEQMHFVKYEKGDIWDTYRFSGKTVAGPAELSSNLIVEFRIFNVAKKIEIVYRLRKKAVTDPEAVYISFPFEVEHGKIYSDVPGGVIEVGVDQIFGSSNDWYTVQNFATVRNAKSQVVMGSPQIPLMQFGAINTGRYTAGATPQSTNMYSWPMNNYWTTNFSASQEGELEWSYFINSSTDNSIAYATQFAWENRIPFLVRVLPAGIKSIKPLQPTSIFRIIPNNLLLVNMKPVDGENAVMLQLREIGGQPAKFAVTSDKVNFKRVTVCDVVGDPMPDKPSPDFTPWESKFIKLSW